MASSSKWTVKDSIGGILGGSIPGAFGVWMLVDPNRIPQASQSQGRGAMLMRLLEAIWGVPGGITIIAVSLIVVGISVCALVRQPKVV